MDRFDILDIIKVLDTVGSKRRFSNLNLEGFLVNLIVDLLVVWKEITSYVEEQLLQNRSISVPQLGTFYILKGTTTTTNFIPYHAWEKIPGYKIEKTTQQGSISAQILRFTAIAVRCKISRDDIETGLKDIIYALTKILKRGSVAILTIGNIGKLHFQNNAIKMRYSNSFLKFISVLKPTVDQVPLQKEVEIKESPNEDFKKIVSKKAHEKLPILAAPRVPKPVIKEEAPKIEDIEEIPQVNIEKSQESDQKALEKLPVIEKEVKKGFEMEQIAPDPEPQLEAQKKNESLEELQRLVENTLGMGHTHTHHYSGDRQWNDEKCPICRVNAQKAVFETKEQTIKKEKLNDKAIMTLALEIDKELIKKARELDLKRHNQEIANSQFNYQNFIENEQKKKAEVKNHPMGNLFEHRIRPDLVEKYQQQQDLADYLHQQIDFKHEKARKEKQERDLEKIQNQELISRALKKSEIDANLTKLVKWRDQRDALSEQIKARKEREQIKPESPCENPHARSESLMVLYKKEKAKQLYLEQIELMKQKKEYEAKISELDRQNSLERVIHTRKRLEKDLKSIKIAKYQQRKSLEEYWKQQLAMK